MDEKKLQKELEKVFSHFELVLAKIQTWKASTGLLEQIDVYVPSWWQTQNLQWLWNVSLLDSQTLKIESWDKWVLPHIEKAIRDAQLWLNPLNQWEWIMIKIPPMTEERRKEIALKVGKELENAKISVRNVRHSFVKDIKWDFDAKEITEDEKRQYENELDQAIKNMNKKLEDIAKEKEKEIMSI